MVTNNQSGYFENGRRQDTTLGIFAPSRALNQDESQAFERGLTLLKEQGLNYKLAANLGSSQEILPGSKCFVAGALEQRLEEFTKLYEDPEVDILLALCGGYGCTQLLERLDYEIFKTKPKPILGYSDLTALFMAIQAKAFRHKLPLFHTPMLFELSSLREEEKQSFFALLGNINLEAYSRYEYVAPQKISGGNLSMLVSLLGTEYFDLSFTPNVLLLEDCNEEAYKIERMIYQLYYAGVFRAIQELWLGEALNCSYNLELLTKVSEQEGFTLRTGLPYGHSKKMSVAVY